MFTESRAIADLPERGRRQGNNPVQALAVRREPSPGVSVVESAITSSEAIVAKLGQGCLMQFLWRSEDLKIIGRNVYSTCLLWCRKVG